MYFTGHSLGSGLASANALATGYPAFTYNAAGLSSPTKSSIGQIFNTDIDATIVEGEIVDVMQRKCLGIHAEGDITYINGEDANLALDLLLDHFENDT